MKNVQTHLFLLGRVSIRYEILKEHLKTSGYAKYGGFSLKEWPLNIQKDLKILIFQIVSKLFVKNDLKYFF